MSPRSLRVLAVTVTELAGVMSRNRAAVTTASPMTVRFPPTRTKPVAMAMRTCNGSPDCDRTSPILSTTSRPACTARSASFSWPFGYPNDARVSSPTKLITAPPQCVMTEVQISWKRRMVPPKSSGSTLTASAVESTSSHASTVNCRLCGSECGAALPWLGVPAGMASPPPDWLSGSGSRAGDASPLAALCGRTSNLYLTPQAGDEHIDAAVIGFRATPRDGVTELVARQHPARTVHEGGQQRGLGAGQPHFPAAAIDEGMAGQVELAVLDF